MSTKCVLRLPVSLFAVLLSYSFMRHCCRHTMFNQHIPHGTWVWFLGPVWTSKALCKRIIPIWGTTTWWSRDAFIGHHDWCWRFNISGNSILIASFRLQKPSKTWRPRLLITATHRMNRPTICRPSCFWNDTVDKTVTPQYLMLAFQISFLSCR